MGLLDPVEPASGIYIQYQGGNTCPNSWADKADCFVHESDDDLATSYCARSFRLNINCHGEIDEIPYEEYVEEAGGCAYEVTINHKAGCPLECPRHNGRVCSANGICFYEGYDSGADVGSLSMLSSPVGCICEDGYYGDACEYEGYLTVVLSNPMAAPAPGSTALTIFLIFALVFLLYLFRAQLVHANPLLCFFCIKAYNATGGSASSPMAPKRWLYEPVSAVEIADEEYGGGKSGTSKANFGASFTNEEDYGLEIERPGPGNSSDRRTPPRSSVLYPPSSSPSAQLAQILTSSSTNPTTTPKPTPTRKSKKDKTPNRDELFVDNNSAADDETF